MKREEAIEILKNTLAYESNFAEAKQMAIEALEQEPCEDAIDKYEALAILDPLSVEYKEMKALPFVQPKRPTGKWLEKEVFDNQDSKVIECYQSARCSICGKYHTTPYSYFFDNYNFCPNCGTDMKERK